MTVQILISTMNRQEFSFLEAINGWGHIIVINQCEKNQIEKICAKQCSFTIIHTTQRGLSNSRNEAILHSDADIFLTADDDISYMPDAADIIKKNFMDHPKADIIAFNINRLNIPEHRNSQKKNNNWSRTPSNKYYPSVSLAYRRTSYDYANLHFHPIFGAGGIYTSGEESLLLKQARKAGLKIYQSQETIATVDFSTSSWFTGYNEKFFFDKGAWLVAAYPKTHAIIKFYFLKIRNSQLTKAKMLKMLGDGSNCFLKKWSYETYKKSKGK